ncbi:MAG: KpsF/GutQ family sugar-phosphate isomerase [Burkholderiales bacterium]|nr:KpsF/GutQ family sugar-phosphate isomerase [Burkholderiales bacterium]
MNTRASDEVARTADAARALALARQVLAVEAAAIATLAERLGGSFVAAVDVLLQCRGRIVVCGIGKSGHVARKVAATFASTGSPSFFVHATEAMHGDLGMIAADDVVIMISNSGETDELLSLLPHVKRAGAPIVALTGNEQSSLAQGADVHLDARVDAEACPLGLAPTASTTAALALGDALALALLDARGFSAYDFLRSHPAGALGRRLVRVADVMRTGDALPVTPIAASLVDAIAQMSRKGMGMTVVVHGDGRVAGIFTDGDLRRCIARLPDLAQVKIADVMTARPRAVRPDTLAIDCVEAMETPPKVSQLVVVDDAGVLRGALHLHDLFREKIV